MHKKEFIVEVNSADDGDILICQLPKDWLPPIPIKKELIRCKDCKRFDGDTWCFLFEHGIQENDFCARAERKEQ